MKSFLESAPYSELQDWLQQQLEKEYKERSDNGEISVSPSEPKQHATHDVFNIYRYGDIIKVVYLKTCPVIKTDERGKKSKIKGKAENVEQSAEQSAERFAQSLSRTRARIFELAA